MIYMQPNYFFKGYIWVFLLLISSKIEAQKTIFSTPLSARIANYDIDVKLNTETKTLRGKQTLTWQNTSNDVLNELQFHLYLNAFKDENSTFMKESGGRLRSDTMEKSKENWGWINLLSCKIRGGENLSNKIQFIQPDDLNEKDRTVIRIPLKKPIQPNETIILDMNFEAKLPKIFARTGFADDYFLVAQWFPKIGVYESAGTRYATRGQWNCHQFHADTEFYADFGVYNVKMTVPKDYTVGATGVFQNERENADGTKTIFYHAEDVHDFAWTASPRYKVYERKWKYVNIKALMQPEHTGSTERYFDAAIKALEYFEKHLGKYPHPVLTLIDPPLAGEGSMGMEYPTFITCMTSWGMPSGLRYPEIVTVHEFGHQYFQGMLASNEFEESWLDEGFNQYYEGRIMDEAYGTASQIDFWGFRLGDTESARMSYVSMKNPKISESFREAWRYPRGTYGVLTYMKTAAWLKTLENMIGRAVMDEVMQTYFIRWRFKHPSAKDFIAIVNEIVPKRIGQKYGENLDWYFEQVLYRANICDYSVKSLKEKGFTIEQLGDIQIPIEILVKFTDGSTKQIWYEGKSFLRSFEFEKPILSVKIDPQNKILLDLNYINNSQTRKPSALPALKYSAKFMFWFQGFIQFVVSLI